MALNKKFQTNPPEVVTGAVESKTDFVVGTQYTLDQRLWRITSAFIDSSVDMRQAVCMDDGTIELLALTTLEKDAKLGSLKIVEG